MPLILYKVDKSAPVRTVLLTAKALGLDLEMREVNLMAGEHLKPEFIKLNPQHTVPTLVDEDFVIWDSHAIAAYLVRKYAKGNPLYPEDPCERAVVDQRLHFDTGVLFPLLKEVAGPIFKKEAKAPSETAIENTHETYKLLEIFLDGHDWVAGDNMTIADFALIAIVTTIDFFVPITADEYPNICAWIERCQALPFYQEGNEMGLEEFKVLFAALTE